MQNAIHMIALFLLIICFISPRMFHIIIHCVINTNRKKVGENVEQYDSISWLYEVLYAGYNKEELGQAFIDEHEELFSRYRNARFHDASCGNGVQAVALKAHGYEISASDISEEMLRLTHAHAIDKKVELSTFKSAWSDIQQHVDHKFDIVLCVGNSISHTRNYSERFETLKRFYEILNEGGTLLLDTRNWDSLVDNGLSYKVLNKRNYGGKTYVPIYLWGRVQLEEESLLRLVFIEFDGERQAEYERTITYTPFSHDALLEMCRESGFVVEKDTFNMDEDRYYVYLRK